MVSISELYGGEQQLIQRIKNSIGFNTHVALPAVVQSVNLTNQTVDVQPTVRERIISQTGEIQYVQYPLLINVPIVFPQVGAFRITFPIERGDECFVIFADIAIDNWWKSGNVQNPVEQRRHDLSDGFAFFGALNQEKIGSQPAISSSGLEIKSTKTGTGIHIGSSDITFTCSSGSVTLSQLLAHYHIDGLGSPTSAPIFNSGGGST